MSQFKLVRTEKEIYDTISDLIIKFSYMQIALSSNLAQELDLLHKMAEANPAVLHLNLFGRADN